RPRPRIEEEIVEEGDQLASCVSLRRKGGELHAGGAARNDRVLAEGHEGIGRRVLAQARLLDVVAGAIRAALEAQPDHGEAGAALAGREAYLPSPTVGVA